MIPTDSNDKIITDVNNKKRRIITYTINKTEYFLATNIYDTVNYTVEIFKQLYHDRWKIEEFFKQIKYITDFAHMKEKNQEKLMKQIYGQLIVCRLTDLLKRINGDHKSTNQIINNIVLADGVYSDFLYDFFNGKMDVRNIRQFLNLFIAYQTTNSGKDKHNPRTSAVPYSKWYIKRYHNNYKTGTLDQASVKRKLTREEKKAAKLKAKEQKKINKKEIMDKKKEATKMRQLTNKQKNKAERLVQKQIKIDNKAIQQINRKVEGIR